MNDTPRVTVPPQALEAIAFNLCSLHDFDVAFVRENERFATAVITEYARTLSAAPAPEGGAVLEDALDTWIIEGIKKADQRLAEIDPAGCCGMTSEDVQSGRVAAYQKGFQNGVKSTLTDASFVIMNAALATREEDPAGAGERDALIRELSDAARWRRLPGHENHHATASLFERAVEALRAQPQAREEALPVAWRWRVKRTETWHATTSREFAHEHDANLCETEPLYTHPAPDALRVAVEAFMPTNIDLTNTNLRDDQVLPCDVTVGELRAISAALQAEQKGGA